MKWNETDEIMDGDTGAEERIAANCLNKIELNVKIVIHFNFNIRYSYGGQVQ